MASMFILIYVQMSIGFIPGLGRQARHKACPYGTGEGADSQVQRVTLIKTIVNLS